MGDAEYQCHHLVTVETEYKCHHLVTVEDCWKHKWKMHSLMKYTR